MKRADLVPRAETSTQQTTAATAVSSVLAYAREQNRPVDELYRSVLVWRFDLLQRVGLASVDRREAPGHKRVLPLSPSNSGVFSDHIAVKKKSIHRTRP